MPRRSLRLGFVLLALFSLPLLLSFARLPGLPEIPKKSTGLGAFAAAIELAIPLYDGSTLAFGLLPLVTLWQLALAFIGRKSNDADDLASRKQHSRVVLLAGTLLLAVALAALRAWTLAQHLGTVAPGSPLPVFGLVVQAALFIGLVRTALEVSRRGGASGIVALVAGDWLSRDVSRIRSRSDFVADALGVHATEAVALVLVVAVFVFVLREAPARAPGALARLRERLQPLWPLGAAALVKAAAVTLLVAEAVSGRGFDDRVLEETIALGLIVGGLALVLATDDATARRTGLDGMLHPTENALVPSLAAAAVATFVAWRASVAASGAEPYLPGPVNELIQLVGEHRLLVSSLAGIATLSAAFVLSRRAPAT